MLGGYQRVYILFQLVEGFSYDLLTKSYGNKGDYGRLAFSSKSNSMTLMSLLYIQLSTSKLSVYKG